jgi:probable HAF family extracellular repeat protein
MKSTLLSLCFFSMVLATATPCMALAPCRVIDLGTTGGGRVSAINDSTQIVGRNINGPFLWENGVFTPLPALGYASTPFHKGEAYDINNHGQIVGWSFIDETSDERHACLWDDGAVIDIVVLEEAHTSNAYAINDAGQVVVSTSNGHAFLWQDGLALDLHPAGLGGITTAYDINNLGQIVGKISLAGTFAAIWEDNQFSYLDNTPQSGAVAINDTGMIVGGWNCGGSACPRYWYWNDETLQWEIGAVGPSPSSMIEVNNAGIIVGRTGINSGLYWEDGDYHSLSSLIPENSGWSIGIPSDINNKGQVVGVGGFKGEQRFYLLTPTPICLSNVDNDQDVDGDDLAVFAAAYSQSGDEAALTGDYDYDGDVDGADLAAVLVVEIGCTECP